MKPFVCGGGVFKQTNKQANRQLLASGASGDVLLLTGKPALHQCMPAVVLHLQSTEGRDSLAILLVDMSNTVPNQGNPFSQNSYEGVSNVCPILCINKIFQTATLSGL